MKNEKIGIIFCIVLLALFGIIFFNACDEPQDTIIPYDEKIYWKGTIDDDFDDSTVILVMDRNYSRINKVHKKSFFGNIEIESIEDLTYVTDISTIIYPEDWRQILLLTLPVNSKENVVNAIRHLEKIIGIMSAEPNFLYEAVND